MKRQILPYKDFLPFAPSNAGETVKIHHCKRGKHNDRLYITRSMDGSIVCYCHHCGGTGYYQDGKKVYTRRTVHVQKKGTFTEIPKGGTTRLADWSVLAKVWINKAHIGQKLIRQYGLQSFSNDDSVMIPIMNEGKLCRLIKRSFDPDLPKYLTLMHDNFHNANAYVFHSRAGDNTRLILVEDVLSAIRVAEYVDALVLCGTNMNSNLLVNALNKSYDHIKIFLDNDNPMVKKSQRKIQRRLDSIDFHTDTTVIENDVDPKEMSSDRLCEVIYG